MNSLITVIIPVYNCEKYVKKCVDSIVAQTYHNIEIIIIDDGSNDNTGSICDSFADSDPRITVRHQVNSGVSVARNSGLLIAKGEYIVFVDGDDWIEADAIETLHNAMIRVNADACFSTGMYKDEFSRKSFTCSSEISAGVYESNDLLRYHLKGGFISSACMGLMNADIIKEVAFNQEIYMLEDWLFNTEMLLNCKRVSIIDRPLYHYRTNSESVSQTNLTQRKLTALQISDFTKQLLDNRETDLKSYSDCVPAFLINSMAVLLAKSNYELCKDESLALKRYSRKNAIHILRCHNNSVKSKVYVVLCAINPRLFCIGFNLKNKGRIV